MKEYFQLQFKMFNRKSTEFGLPPLLAYILLSLIFIIASTYLFNRTEFAGYLYVLTALYFLTKQTDIKRNEFLKTCFSYKKYLKIRALENSVIIAPFILFLIYQKSTVFIPVLMALACVFTILNFNTSFSIGIPTPFYKRPFEFTVGFRNTFFMFPIAYFITCIAISVGNYNLGLFSMILIFIVVLSYYSKLETEYYIWCYNLSAKKFLTKKIKIGLVYSTLSSIPILTALGIFFYEDLQTTVMSLILCYAYLATLVLAKYSAYPNEMNIPQGILIVVSLVFPPVLIFIIPYFYSRSNKKLNTILP